ncbi:zinc ribbon domain-containing protein [Clostridium sp.]|uniref:zinc ribbon domain-containing protein n=1 Tax=Clostridium sp. TaxID=1506 RepID=UPI0026083B32|nr:zinc ribbon domain-containing protein [Clostridium sp.]
MFFIGIFGIENKQKEIKKLENIECSNCEVKTRGALIKSYEYFHIFFIPIFKWNEKYFVMCKRCNSVYEVSKEKGKLLEKGENIDVRAEDMVLLKKGKSYGRKALKKYCPNCGEVLDGEYKYCPYCGVEI